MYSHNIHFRVHAPNGTLTVLHDLGLETSQGDRYGWVFGDAWRVGVMQEEGPAQPVAFIQFHGPVNLHTAAAVDTSDVYWDSEAFEEVRGASILSDEFPAWQREFALRWRKDGLDPRGPMIPQLTAQLIRTLINEGVLYDTWVHNEDFDHPEEEDYELFEFWSEALPGWTLNWARTPRGFFHGPFELRCGGVLIGQSLNGINWSFYYYMDSDESNAVMEAGTPFMRSMQEAVEAASAGVATIMPEGWTD